MGKSRLHTNELSPVDPNRCDHRCMGNQFYRISVCRLRGSSIERRGSTMATSHGCCHSGVCRLRSVCFWQVAIAIKSSRSIGYRDTHREGRPDERLPRFRRTGIKVVRRICFRNPPHYSSRNAGCCLPEKIGRISETALGEVDSLYSSTAAETRAAIVLGVVRKTPPGSFNSSRLYSADGKLEANYDKHHLMPGVEP